MDLPGLLLAIQFLFYIFTATVSVSSFRLVVYTVKLFFISFGTKYLMVLFLALRGFSADSLGFTVILSIKRSG